MCTFWKDTKQAFGVLIGNFLGWPMAFFDWLNCRYKYRTNVLLVVILQFAWMIAVLFGSPIGLWWMLS